MTNILTQKKIKRNLGSKATAFNHLYKNYRDKWISYVILKEVLSRKYYKLEISKIYPKAALQKFIFK